MNRTSKIYIAGHTGLVGSAILKNLKTKGYSNLLVRSHKELDLTNSQAVADFFKKEEPEYIFLAAAKVGGISANNEYRADFIYTNLMIQNNIIHNSYLTNVKKLLFLGSTCIYPKNCPQPIKEEYLLTDILEYTNEPYAIAKIAGIKMCESYNLQYDTNYISVMPTNLYGPEDNFSLETSHVLPALVRKIHLGKALEEEDWEMIKMDLTRRPIEGISGEDSKEKITSILNKHGITYTRKNKDDVGVTIWGTGKPKREFLYSEDLAEACVFVMDNIDFKDVLPKNSDSEQYNYSEEIRNTHLNIGTGKDISIKELASLIKSHIGFNGSLSFDTSKPDGTPRKLTDVSKINDLGWKHRIDLSQGINKINNWYLQDIQNAEVN